MPWITRGGDVHVELAAGEVVEEEQRFGALHQNVVHAHRHQVDADGVVPVELERELELGADAIGAGDQHRLAITLRDLEQRAETADAGQHLWAHGAPGERLDALDQRIAGIDVDARVTVRKRGVVLHDGILPERAGGGGVKLRAVDRSRAVFPSSRILAEMRHARSASATPPLGSR